MRHLKGNEHLKGKKGDGTGGGVVKEYLLYA